LIKCTVEGVARRETRALKRDEALKETKRTKSLGKPPNQEKLQRAIPKLVVFRCLGDRGAELCSFLMEGNWMARRASARLGTPKGGNLRRRDWGRDERS